MAKKKRKPTRLQIGNPVTRALVRLVIMQAKADRKLREAVVAMRAAERARRDVTAAYQRAAKLTS